MDTIRYINDVNLDYNKEVINGLKSYNQSQTGYREKDRRDFYVFEEGRLIGACHTKQESDWCKIKGIYYEDLDTLKALVNDIRKFYRSNVEGIMFNTVLDQRSIEFQKVGFNVQGELDDMPKGNKNIFLIDKELDNFETGGDYHVESSSEPISPYDRVLKTEMKRYRESLDFSTDRIDVQFVALDGEQFVGGIYGNFQFEYLFINILFVDQEYRGNKIASKLMEMIEDEAARRGVKNLYLTTFEFQALDFYKKHGYEVVMKIDDFPKGFAEYTIYKELQIE